MLLIIGLGNPGPKYENTYHNIGFIFLDKLREKWNFPVFTPNSKFQAELSQGTFGGNKIILAKPQTYMNLSGETVQALLGFYKLSPGNLIVIHDDIDIATGKIKIAQDSTSAGHNGVQNIIDLVGTKKFIRLRIGIKKTEEDTARNTADYVLGKIDEEDSAIILKLMKNEMLETFERLPLLSAAQDT